MDSDAQPDKVADRRAAAAERPRRSREPPARPRGWPDCGLDERSMAPTALKLGSFAQHSSG